MIFNVFLWTQCKARPESGTYKGCRIVHFITFTGLTGMTRKFELSSLIVKLYQLSILLQIQSISVEKEKVLPFKYSETLAWLLPYLLVYDSISKKLNLQKRKKVTPAEILWYVVTLRNHLSGLLSACMWYGFLKNNIFFIFSTAQIFQEDQPTVNDITTYNWKVDAENENLEAHRSVNATFAFFQNITITSAISWPKKDVDLNLGPIIHIR